MVTRRTNSNAVISLVLGILSFVIIPIVGAIAAILFGHRARSEIGRDEGVAGDGLAVAGVVLGYVNLVLSLVGLLVVVVLLRTVPGVANQMEKAKINTANLHLKLLGDALDLYKIKFDRYPDTLDGLTNAPEGKRPVLDRVPKDPWDAEFIFRSPGLHNSSSFDLQSKGPDGIADTEDDLKNW